MRNAELAHELTQSSRRAHAELTHELTQSYRRANTELTQSSRRAHAELAQELTQELTQQSLRRRNMGHGTVHRVDGVEWCCTVTLLPAPPFSRRSEGRPAKERERASRHGTCNER